MPFVNAHALFLTTGDGRRRGLLSQPRPANQNPTASGIQRAAGDQNGVSICEEEGGGWWAQPRRFSPLVRNAFRLQAETDKKQLSVGAFQILRCCDLRCGLHVRKERELPMI